MKKIKSLTLPLLTLAAALWIYIVDQEKGVQIAVLFLQTCKSTIPILLLMFLLLSFLKFGMDTSKIQKSMKKKDGVKSTLFAYLFGTLVSGPIYPGFALGNILIQGGVRVRTVVIMLSVWATLKIPLLPYELKILGAKLCVVRWIVTGIMIFILSFICDKICFAIEKKSTKQSIIKQEERTLDND